MADIAPATALRFAWKALFTKKYSKLRMLDVAKIWNGKVFDYHHTVAALYVYLQLNKKL